MFKADKIGFASTKFSVYRYHFFPPSHTTFFKPLLVKLFSNFLMFKVRLIWLEMCLLALSDNEGFS